MFHDPDLVKMRAEGRKRGGRNRAAQHGGDSSKIPAEVKTVADVLKVLQYTLAELVAQPNGAVRARALIACALGFLRALDVGEFDARLTEVERVLKLGGGK